MLQQALDYGTQRFIHISSTAVYGVPDHHPLYETDKVFGVGPYGEAKVQAEAICREFVKKACASPSCVPSPSSVRKPGRVRHLLRMGQRRARLPHDRLGEKIAIN